MNVELAQGRPADAEDIRRLCDAWLGRGPSVPRLRELMDAFPSVVARRGGELVGVAYGSSIAPDVIQLANLVVAKPERGNGLGSRLVRDFERRCVPSYRYAVVSNSAFFTVPPGEERRSAVPLYERLGYSRLLSTPHTVLLVRELHDGAAAPAPA